MCLAAILIRYSQFFDRYLLIDIGYSLIYIY